MDEEELLQAQSEHNGTAEQEEQTTASAICKFKNKIFQGTLKRPRYQPEMASAALMKYLVESDKKRQAEPPVDPIDTFFKSISATVKMFSPLQVKNICDCILSGIDRNFKRNQIFTFIRIFFRLSR
jgi:hypothetical protein